MKVLIFLLFPAICLGELTADLNGDGTVDFADFAVMMDEWLMSDYYLDYFADLEKYVSVANSAVLTPGTGNFTISLWEYGGTTGVLISKNRAGISEGYGIYLTAAGNLECRYADKVYLQTTAPETTSWHHIAWSHDAGGNDILYVDGVVGDTLFTARAEDYGGVAYLTIGRQFDAPFGYFDGALDDIRIYKGTALTAAQVSDIYYYSNGWKVNEAEFSAITSNGWYSNCDDGSGLALTGRLLTAGTWTAHNGLLTSADLWAAGGIPLHCIDLDSTDFEEYTRYINRTSKRIQYRFRSKDDFQLREYKILNPHIESDR